MLHSFSIHLTTTFSKLLFNSYMHHHHCIHFQAHGLSLLLSSTISKVQLNFRGLAASLGTQDARVTLLRALHAKEGAGCGELPALPASKWHKPWQPKEAEAGLTLPVTGSAIDFGTQVYQPMSMCWVSGRTHHLSQTHAGVHQLNKHLYYYHLIGIHSVRR